MWAEKWMPVAPNTTRECYSCCSKNLSLLLVRLTQWLSDSNCSVILVTCLVTIMKVAPQESSCCSKYRYCLSPQWLSDSNSTHSEFPPEPCHPDSVPTTTTTRESTAESVSQIALWFWWLILSIDFSITAGFRTTPPSTDTLSGTQWLNLTQTGQWQPSSTNE